MKNTLNKNKGHPVAPQILRERWLTSDYSSWRLFQPGGFSSGFCGGAGGAGAVAAGGAALGTIYGRGNGKSTFNLPSLGHVALDENLRPFGCWIIKR